MLALPSPHTTTAAQTLRELALELGFDVAGWASGQVPRQAWQSYGEWLESGRQAGMAYLETGAWRRADLSTSLLASQGVGRVLALGISHAFEETPPPKGGLRAGRVAQYAHTPDYHAQIEPLLARLVSEATSLGVRARGYVDHGPLMERDLAGRAFLGWHAKSGMLVSTELGAFVTLAAVLTDLPDQPDEPAHPDRCGRCTRCISACPTGAIDPDRAIDARKCVSYLTIEHRGPVDWALRPGIGEWLLGCDVCCAVCPWSLKAGKLARTLRPDPELAHPDLLSFFGVSEREFARRYQHAAHARPRRKGMARNAVTVAGNLGEERLRPVLDLAAADPAWEVREAATYALWRWQDRAGLERLRTDPHPQVQAGAERGLKALSGINDSVPSVER
ncbi:tRNA epoxyqueuosine(34) reductase QueG [Deinococcus psychrotolerans]|uniref:tRNA epoxyqueuosine(34) reductase QueG n=1 Tax=Deinococcus psychrotolerans TaxID=2489213 RepID=A0A3G8YC39_9DEIO|nr:tRNA epoxyqueuosine(34) reductase QueG [Deinococcus psychrotolerans]AZI42500.1 tRNA epoxyqueuosine(34) reductase QueG [Deinococcus psychrotolerans]